MQPTNKVKVASANLAGGFFFCVNYPFVEALNIQVIAQELKDESMNLLTFKF